jgi:hypothetical protein
MVRVNTSYDCEGVKKLFWVVRVEGEKKLAKIDIFVLDRSRIWNMSMIAGRALVGGRRIEGSKKAGQNYGNRSIAAEISAERLKEHYINS